MQDISTNNCVGTVHSLFIEAVQRFALQLRVCSDEGGENVTAALHML